jgi:phosphatidylglycerophosphatase A
MTSDGAGKRRSPAWIAATVLGAGYAPKAPGTAGSLVALLIAVPLAALGANNLLFLLISLGALYPAIVASGIVAGQSGVKDPSIVVIDEVVGQWLTFAGALRMNWRSFLIAFVLFRFFDILKPPPIRLIERLPGGAGIVLDDMMAGAFAALVLFLTGWFNLY